MPTKAEQARINGAKSKGATTPEGIQKCRLASVKHGGYVAATAVLPGENPAQYQAIFDGLVDQYDPRNIAELHIVNAIADAIWRQRRLTAAAQLEIQRQMYSFGYEATHDHAMAAATHLTAEIESVAVTRLEARARHQTREIARLQRILNSMQKHDVSDEASQRAKEILDLAAERYEAAAKSAVQTEPPKPQTPEKQPPHVEGVVREPQIQARE